MGVPDTRSSSPSLRSVSVAAVALDHQIGRGGVGGAEAQLICRLPERAERGGEAPSGEARVPKVVAWDEAGKDNCGNRESERNPAQLLAPRSVGLARMGSPGGPDEVGKQEKGGCDEGEEVACHPSDGAAEEVKCYEEKQEADGRTEQFATAGNCGSLVCHGAANLCGGRQICVQLHGFRCMLARPLVTSIKGSLLA